MLLFNTIIKTLNNTDVLTLCVHEKDRDNLIIKIENKDKFKLKMSKNNIMYIDFSNYRVLINTYAISYGLYFPR